MRRNRNTGKASRPAKTEGGPEEQGSPQHGHSFALSFALRVEGPLKAEDRVYTARKTLWYTRPHTKHEVTSVHDWKTLQSGG